MLHARRMLSKATAVGLTMVLLGLALLAGVVSRARADEDARARERARAHYEAGAQLYARAQYLDAVQEFERAYALSGAKPLLFNIAQAYRLLGPAHCQQALDGYERYLAADPGAENRGEVEERIASMRSCLEAQSQVREERAKAPEHEQRAEPSEPAQTSAMATAVRVTPAREAAVDRPETVRRARLAPLSLIVGGSVVALGGVALYALARSEYERAEGSCPCPEGSYARWERVTRASYGLAAAGGASLASGLVWLGALRTSRYSLGIAPWRVKFTGRF